jgi:hypothetical protein
MEQRCKTMYLRVKFAFVGVMNEHFSQDARNEECRKSVKTA